MIDASMLLHMISALETLEKLIPGEEAGEYAAKEGMGSPEKSVLGRISGQGEESGQGNGNVKDYM